MTARKSVKTLQGLQLLRGAAALAVVFHHLLNNDTFFPATPDRIVALGQLGVDVFFIVSGFVMYYAEYDRAQNIGASHRFLIRRFIRIWPLYALFTIAMSTAYFSGLLFHSRSISMRETLSSLLLFPTQNTVLVVGWTLHYEAFFYVVFSLFLLTRSMNLIVLLIPVSFLAIVVLSNVIYFDTASVFTFFSNTIIFEFCFGMIVAATFKRSACHRSGAAVAFFCGIIGLVIGSIVGLSDEGNLDPTWRFLYWGVPSALLVYSSLRVADLRGTIGRIGLFFGDASYSLYLTHSFVIMSAVKLMWISNGSELIFAGLALSGALLIGAATYVGIERPVTNYLNRAWTQRQRKIEPVAAQRIKSGRGVAVRRTARAEKVSRLRRSARSGDGNGG